MQKVEKTESTRRPGYALGGSLRQVWSVMREMSRMLEAAHGADMAPGSYNVNGNANREWEPVMTEMPAEDDLVMYFELPGVEREDVDLSLHGNSLVVSGVKKEFPSFDEVTVEDVISGNVELGPVRNSPFKRLVELPAAVGQEEIEATFGAGLLQVRARGAAENRSRRIHIRAGNRPHG